MIRPRAEIAGVIRAYTGAPASRAQAAADAVLLLVVERYRLPRRRLWVEARRKIRGSE
jgi:hypothetical protein